MHDDSDHYVEIGSDQAEEEKGASGGGRGSRVAALSTVDDPAHPQATAYRVHDDPVEDGGYSDDDDEYADGHPIFASNCDPVIPSWCLGGTRAIRKDPGAELVFSSPASYHCWNVFLLTILPICTVLSMALVYTDRTVPHQDKTRDLLVLWMTCVGALMLLFLLLPRRIELHSDSTVAVVSYLFSHEFPHVVDASNADEDDFYADDANARLDHHDPDAAHTGDDDKEAGTEGVWSTENSSERWDRGSSSPRIRCATNFVSRVLLRRRVPGAGELWDLVVSPQDPRGMVDAVKRVARARDEASMRAQVYTI
jgi:hypothetical protein